MRTEKPASEGMGVREIGKLDIELFRCVSEYVSTSEVIVTDVQINHIKQRHPEALAEFEQFAPIIISDPDYVLKNRPNAGLLLKEITESGQKYQLVLQIRIPQDPAEYKNSVITFTRIRDKEWNRLLRNKIILYKKE